MVVMASGPRAAFSPLRLQHLLFVVSNKRQILDEASIAANV
jgi:hypothetical protein